MLLAKALQAPKWNYIALGIPVITAIYMSPELNLEAYRTLRQSGKDLTSKAQLYCKYKKVAPYTQQ